MLLLLDSRHVWRCCRTDSPVTYTTFAHRAAPTTFRKVFSARSPGRRASPRRYATRESDVVPLAVMLFPWMMFAENGVISAGIDRKPIGVRGVTVAWIPVGKITGHHAPAQPAGNEDREKYRLGQATHSQMSTFHKRRSNRVRARPRLVCHFHRRRPVRGCLQREYQDWSVACPDRTVLSRASRSAPAQT